MTNNSPDAAPPPAMSRRGVLASTGLAAAGMMLLNDVAAADNPAANVADKTTAIKITALKVMVAGPKAYLKISTNYDVVGWGEVTGLEPKVACALAESL